MSQSKQILKNNSFIDGKEGGLLPHGLENCLHLLPLLLGQVVGSDSLLQELQTTLLLANPKKGNV